MNLQNSSKFTQTDVYKTWYAAVGEEGRFQAFARHWCGQEYTGPLRHMIESETSFKKMYCPSKLSTENHYITDSFYLI